MTLHSTRITSGVFVLPVNVQSPMTTLRRRTNSDREKENWLPDYYNFLLNSQNTQLNNSSCDMTCRDRTIEFMSVVKTKEGRMNDPSGYLSKRGRYLKGNTLKEWSNFMQIAREIGNDISRTFTKLEKLTLLAKKRSLFNDDTVEITELSYIIKQDINSLNKQIAKLQEVSKAKNYSHSGKHMQSHSNSVVVSLQSKLASMSNDFKEVLEVRTENLKHEKHRREQFSEGHVSASLPASAISGNSGSVLLSDENLRSEVAIDMDNINLNQRFNQQIQLVDQQDSYIQNRAEAMQSIEATIVELGSIFQQLADMVKMQEEMVQRIDSNVEDAQLNVEAAHSEILKYFQSVTSNRWLMIKVFGILIIFFVIFVVFIA